MFFIGTYSEKCEPITLNTKSIERNLFSFLRKRGDFSFELERRRTTKEQGFMVLFYI